MQDLRDAIAGQRLEAFAREFLSRYRSSPAKAGVQTREALI